MSSAKDGGCLIVGIAQISPVWLNRDQTLDKITDNSADILANGGSCIAGPDGEWVVEPVVDEEKLIVAALDYTAVLKERQNFDPAGHYARPDVTRLTVNRQRQNTIKIID